MKFTTGIEIPGSLYQKKKKLSRNRVLDFSRYAGRPCLIPHSNANAVVSNSGHDPTKPRRET
jgi:hypothetical protein